MKNLLKRVFIMSKSLYFKSVAAAMILCAISLAGARADEPQGGKVSPQQEKPSADSVLVEAYLVEVSNAALASSGTALLPDDGQKSVSITKLLWCMKDSNSGKVVSMGRAFGRTNEPAKSSATKTVYVSQTTTQAPTTGNAITSVTYQSYDSRSEIAVSPHICEDSSVSLNLKFRYEGFTESKVSEGRQAPPGKLGYNFDSIVMVKPDQPMIVGGMQNGDSSLFLVVRAEIVK